MDQAEGVNINKKIAISFKDVTFKYPSSQSNILENINIDIKDGETVAIVGKSGSGKTTLLILFLDYMILIMEIYILTHSILKI